MFSNRLFFFGVLISCNASFCMEESPKSQEYCSVIFEQCEERVGDVGHLRTILEICKAQKIKEEPGDNFTFSAIIPRCNVDNLPEYLDKVGYKLVIPVNVKAAKKN